MPGPLSWPLLSIRYHQLGEKPINIFAMKNPEKVAKSPFKTRPTLKSPILIR
jgi:hypothetical protein